MSVAVILATGAGALLPLQAAVNRSLSEVLPSKLQARGPICLRIFVLTDLPALLLIADLPVLLLGGARLHFCGLVYSARVRLNRFERRCGCVPDLQVV
jgi:hypothetical protein